MSFIDFGLDQFLPPQFFHPLFTLLELTQCTLGSKPHSDESNIFSNWQKGHSSLEGLGPIDRSPRGLGFHL